MLLKVQILADYILVFQTILNVGSFNIILAIPNPQNLIVPGNQFIAKKQLTDYPPEKKKNILKLGTEKKFLKLLNSEAHLRSKKELIEEFIQNNLPQIDSSDNVQEEFDKFWSEEQQKAFVNLVKEENLSEEKTQKLIENYLYAEREPIRDEILDLIDGDKPSVLERKKMGDRILSKIIKFVDTFIEGIVGR